MADKIYFHNREDTRGAHIKYFSNPTDFKVDEAYSTINKKDVVRGFHRSGTQNKLIQVLSGKARLVILDKKTGLTIHKELTNKDNSIYVPIGTYVGYRALEDNTIINYLAEGSYDVSQDYAIHPFSIIEDPQYIWGYIDNIDNYIISNRDLSAKKVFDINEL